MDLLYPESYDEGLPLKEDPVKDVGCRGKAQASIAVEPLCVGTKNPGVNYREVPIACRT